MKKVIFNSMILFQLIFFIGCDKLDTSELLISINKWEKNDIPKINSLFVTEIGLYSATFEFKLDTFNSKIIETGICLGDETNPTLNDIKIANEIENDNNDKITIHTQDLLPEIKYYYRAYAITDKNILVYSGEKEFATLSLDNSPLYDFDGNIYKTVRIGSQIWMAENLRTTSYNNGVEIDLIENGEDWQQDDAGYSVYENSTINFEEYGCLYNFYTIESEKICPLGWHIPTDDDWKKLLVELGMPEQQASQTGGAGYNEGSMLAGGDWMDGMLENFSVFGATGFNATPGGYCNNYGKFERIGFSGYWWSTTKGNGNDIIVRYIDYNYGYVFKKGYSKKHGFSVRCIKD